MSFYNEAGLADCQLFGARTQGNSSYFMTVETGRRGRCGLAEMRVESG